MSFTFAQDSREFDSFEFSSEKYAYAYYLPVNYDSINSYPVLIGPGDGTPGSDKSYFWDIKAPEEFGWIIIEFPIWNQNSNVVKELMNNLNREFNVEGDKFHIIGFNKSSASSFGHAIANPDYFHSVTGIPGHPSSPKDNQIKLLVNVKVQNIVGERDDIWLEAAENYEEIFELNEVNSTLLVIPNGEHALKDLVGKGFFEVMEKMRN